MLAHQICEPQAFHAEGPVWWPDDGSEQALALRYVDLMAGRVLTLRGEVTTAVSLGDPVAAFLRPREGGGALVAGEHHLYLSDHADLTELRVLATPVEDPAVRFNDGGCDPSGGLLAGTMRYDQATGGARLYSVSPGGLVETVLDAVTVSNGLAFSPDGGRCYYNDTPTRSTWVMDWDPVDGLGERRRLYTLADDASGSGPDGLCVDADGNVWTAIYGGGRIECRSATGALLESVQVPVSRPTSCAFGGDGLRTLFITTTRENVPDGEEPAAGAIFAADVGVQGLPVGAFAG